MAEDLLRTELKAEYARLQDTYEDFDKRSLTIKGWISAAAVAGASLGLKDGMPDKQEIWLIVAVVLLSVWCIETYWKMFQYGFRDRIRVLEAYFRNEADPAAPLVPFQVYHAWYRAYAWDEPISPDENEFRPRHIALRFLLVMLYPFVFLPYLPLLIACLTFYFRLSFPSFLLVSLSLALAICALYAVFRRGQTGSVFRS